MPVPIRFSEKDKVIHLMVGERKLTMHHGDVSSLQADALVCPVDQNLDLRSGVARVISHKAGNDFRSERPVFPEPLGKVIVLPGGNLKVKYIFMTVILGTKDKDRLKFAIREAIDRTIRYAEFLRLKTLAFPVLGCHRQQPSYHFIAREMLEDVTKYFRRRNTKIKMIFLSVFNADAFEAFRDEARLLSDF